MGEAVEDLNKEIERLLDALRTEKQNRKDPIELTKLRLRLDIARKKQERLS